MLNDPLLPDPPVAGKSRPAARNRRPSPAMSAKILATGLATTAMLGLTTGYALAKKTEQPTGTLTPTTETAATGADADPTTTIGQPSTQPNIAAPDTSVARSAQNPPTVVEIPVPQAAPAQPGNNWDGGASQPSSGSR